MGAIQAQDFSMAKWAVGVRLSEPVESLIEASINRGEILRTHVLRPTWHLVSADDIHWMLRLSSPKIKSSLRSRHKELGLTESVLKKTIDIIEKNLSGGLSFTRDELAIEFNKAKIKTDANRLSHILFRAELEEVLCSGPIKENKPTYSLLSERVPVKKFFSREESLAELAKRYFRSRCPATLKDFIWWSNLSVSDAQKAADSVKSDFFHETAGAEKYWFPNSYSAGGLHKKSVNLLPAFDEFLISYKDRSCSLSLVNNRKTVSDNGIFYPTIVANGQVAGIWKRSIKNNKVIIEANVFDLLYKSTRSLIDEQANKFGLFLNRDPEVRYKTEKVKRTSASSSKN